MAGGETKTAEQKDRERDKRLRKTYGITLDQYNEILDAQDGKCAICGRPSTDFAISLNVDHKHFQVIAQRGMSCYGPGGQKGWIASAIGMAAPEVWAKTKLAAIFLMRQSAMPYSVRGLLCPGRHGKAGHGTCNRLLGRVDDVKWLLAAVHYLENPPAKKVLDKSTKQ